MMAIQITWNIPINRQLLILDGRVKYSFEMQTLDEKKELYLRTIDFSSGVFIHLRLKSAY